MQPSTARAKSAGTACSKASSDRRPSPLPVSTACIGGYSRGKGHPSMLVRPIRSNPSRTGWSSPDRMALNASRFLCSMRMRNPNCSSLITNLQCKLAFIENRLRGSPFFEFFEDELHALWMEHLPKQGEHTKSLQAWCDASIQWVCSMCGWTVPLAPDSAPAMGTVAHDLRYKKALEAMVGLSNATHRYSSSKTVSSLDAPFLTPSLSSAHKNCRFGWTTWSPLPELDVISRLHG